jgi:hypothetical protein
MSKKGFGLPPTDAKPPPGHSWLVLGLVLVLLGFVLAASFLLVGIELTLVIAGVVAVLGGAAAFHYVVWGWWLSRFIRDDGDAQEPEATRKSD